MMGSDYMDWDQLKELVNKGNSIGSHTVHHLDLANLSEEKQKQEMSESKQILEEHLGISIKALCFPSGKYNETTVKLLPELGYSLGFTTKPGRVFSGNSQYELHRVRIPNGMSLTGFINSVSY